jgi:hypothetical protein
VNDGENPWVNDPENPQIEDVIFRICRSFLPWRVGNLEFPIDNRQKEIFKSGIEIKEVRRTLLSIHKPDTTSPEAQSRLMTV